MNVSVPLNRQISQQPYILVNKMIMLPNPRLTKLLLPGLKWTPLPCWRDYSTFLVEKISSLIPSQQNYYTATLSVGKIITVFPGGQNYAASTQSPVDKIIMLLTGQLNYDSAIY